MPAPEAVLALVARFERQREALRAPGYNETSLRREFVDPLFRALGWDVDNSAGNAEAYKDVVHEDAVKVGTLTKAPDYSFRIGGTRKFFVEAKKPAVNLKDDASPAYQLRRYAWSGKLPLSILTDFEEFAVYDCRARPASDDKASAHRLLYIRYDEYATRWDEIADVFSRDAVLKGSFDKYAESKKGKRGTATVDKAFLEEIEHWRELLARNLALRNDELTQPQLNFAVQRIIDRIIFLRIAEDRGLEDYGRLLALANGTNAYRRLTDLFTQADARYNSGLFHFRRERDRAETPDDLTPGLTVDDRPLQEIIEGLYYPTSPYEFSVLPADILGQVYEQFLGKVIRLTEGHRAKVEEKPEVKKAGGVYYTPTYIVDYIVKETVGRLLEGRTPKQADALRIVDPACGSGSFLIGAYQHLLDWYRDRYVEVGPEKHKKQLYQGPGGAWRLSSAERKRILLNNVYGVDIDPQAVEVTKLSLLLKVLEGESSQTIQHELTAFRERALPDLGSNIKCGNSLIGPDFYEQASFDDFDEEDRRRINVFDWKAEFSNVFAGRDGGFDAVIGNPPYVRIQLLRQFAGPEVDYLRTVYSSVSRGSFDLYVVFIARSLELLSRSGKLGFIVPNKFMTSDYGLPLRERLSAARSVEGITHFGANQVFAGATTYTCVLRLTSKPTGSVSIAIVDDLADWKDAGRAALTTVPATTLTGEPWHFAPGLGAPLFERLKKWRPQLNDVAAIFVGLQTSADDVFILEVKKIGRKTTIVTSESLGRDVELESSVLRPVVSGTNIAGYEPIASRQALLFPYTVEAERAALISWTAMRGDYPRAAEYLVENHDRLAQREEGAFDDAEWYRFGRSQNLGIQSRPKLCVPRLVEALHAGADLTGSFFLDNVDVGGITVRPDVTASGFVTLPLLMAILNSRLAKWYFPFVSAPFRGNWRSANRQFLGLLPIVTANKDNEQQITRLVGLVTSAISAASTAVGQPSRELVALTAQIDAIVYQLYGLTDAEIRIVEEATA